MLNPTFSKSIQISVKSDYVAPREISKTTLHGNIGMETGTEYRLQKIYGYENWLKLKRAGINSEFFQNKDVLEVCAGTGFLTYHLLMRCKPRQLTVNDISEKELNSARKLVSSLDSETSIKWLLGDIYDIKPSKKFDIIIGNSFIHHFHNVPLIISKISKMLNPGGIFISLHEPTPMSTVVEGGKLYAWPFAIFIPKMINEIARFRYKGLPSKTDLWMFEPKKIENIAINNGFIEAKTIPWGLARPIIVQKNKLHLCNKKMELSVSEKKLLKKAIDFDAYASKFLPKQCFGSISIVCKRRA